MILERLEVRSLGVFRETVAIDFDEAFTLVTGENEAGKSTLFKALHHALFTPYGSSGQDVRDLQPWATSLSPQIEVDFRIGERRYRVTKSFLNQARCVLSLWDGSRFQPFAEADEADAQIRSFLLGERPGTGAAGEKHRGLARLLWVPQGSVTVPELEGAVRTRIEESLDALTLDEGEGRLFGAILSRFEDVWNKKGTDFIKRSGLPELKTELDRLEEELLRLQRVVQEAEQSSEVLRDVEAQLRAEKESELEIRQKRDNLAGEVKRVRDLKLVIEKTRTELEQKKNHLGKLDGLRRDLARRKEELREHNERMSKVLEPRKAAREAELSAANARVEAAQKQLEQAEVKSKRAWDAWQRQRRVSDAKEQMERIASNEETLRTVEGLLVEQKALRDKLSEMPNPTEDEVKEARRLEAELQRLEGRLEATGMKVSFTASSDQKGRISHGDGTHEDIELGVNESHSLLVYRSATWELDGVGTFQFHSGDDEVGDLVRMKENKEEALKSLLLYYGADTAASMEKHRLKRQEVAQELQRLEERITDQLGKGRTLEDVQAELATARRALGSLCDVLGVSEDDLAAIDLSSNDEAETEYESARAHADQARQARDEAKAELDRLIEEVSSIKEEIAGTVEQQRFLQGEISKILTEFGSEERLGEAHIEALLEKEAVEGLLKRREAELPQNDPEKEYETYDRSLDEIGAEIGRLEREEATLREKLRQVADDGAYQQLVATEETLVQKKEEYRQRRLQAEAIKLLKVLAETRHRQVIDQVTGPVSERVSHYFERVTGIVGRRVLVDPELKPTALAVGQGNDVKSDLLSTGAREQLHLLTRLALGRYLAAQHGRMLFVLDDSLVNTDPRRHRRFVDLLLEASQDLQIVLLTCHPERYRGMDGVKKVGVGAVAV